MFLVFIVYFYRYPLDGQLSYELYMCSLSLVYIVALHLCTTRVPFLLFLWTVTHRVLHPVDGLFVVIKVNIIAILKPSNRDHSIIALVIWVQGNAIDDAVSHNHQERIFN